MRERETVTYRYMQMFRQGQTERDMHDTESIMNTQYNVTHDVFLRQQQAHTPKKKKKKKITI